MPDIDPSALSRPPAGGLGGAGASTPVLAAKTLAAAAAAAPGSLKAPKTSQIIPARIDLEPLYAVLKAAVGLEQWTTYKNAISEFMLGRMNQAEYQDRIDPILNTPEKEHNHNQLLAALFANVTREMPDPDLAPWVSANDKPAAPPAPKPVTGDAAERRLKGEIMQLPSRDRRRIKDLAQNNFDPQELFDSAFISYSRRPGHRLVDATPHASSMPNMNLDLEIRKRFNQPLAVESGEFPDAKAVEGRMLPICYEHALLGGHASDAAQLVTLATETFIKETLAAVFSRVRSNAPGEGGTASYGPGTSWIQTHGYKRQIAREEAAFARGEISRDKNGFLPVEAKAAAERAPLGMADLRLAIQIADCGFSRFPAIYAAIMNDYREGELENWNNYSYLPGYAPRPLRKRPQAVVEALAPAAAAAAAVVATTNVGGTGGTAAAAGQTAAASATDHDAMEVDSGMHWEGTGDNDLAALDAVLDVCLAAGG
jgi:transcriptional coactivator HFI1/ADA1